MRAETKKTSTVKKLMGVKIVESDEKLLEKLPAPYVEILKLSTAIDSKGIQAQLGIAEGTVKSRLNRARNALVKLRTEFMVSNTAKTLTHGEVQS